MKYATLKSLDFRIESKNLKDIPPSFLEHLIATLTFSDGYMRARIRRCAREKKNILITYALVNDKAVAMGTLTAASNWCNAVRKKSLMLFVKPYYRRCGIGKKIIVQLEKMSKTEKSTWVCHPWDKRSWNFFHFCKRKREPQYFPLSHYNA